ALVRYAMLELPIGAARFAGFALVIANETRGVVHALLRRTENGGGPASTPASRNLAGLDTALCTPLLADVALIRATGTTGRVGTAALCARLRRTPNPTSLGQLAGGQLAVDTPHVAE